MPPRPVDNFPALVWDDTVSKTSPCVNGTWTTVDKIIEDLKTKTETQLLNEHRELNPSDVRAAKFFWRIQNKK